MVPISRVCAHGIGDSPGSLCQLAQRRRAGGKGSNELIEAVLMVTVEPGKRVVIPQPTFTLYQMLTIILGGEPRPVPLTETLSFDVPRIAEAAAQADVTLLCCPNNPTGSMLSLDEMRSILTAARGLVIIDEAYHEFSRQSAVPLLHEFEHLVVLRTFSKAMSMAGLRVGYLLGHPPLVEQIAKAKLPYNLNIFSMAAAEAAVEHFGLLQPQIELLIQERERLLGQLHETRGVTAYPSRQTSSPSRRNSRQPRCLRHSIRTAFWCATSAAIRCLRTSCGLALVHLRRMISFWRPCATSWQRDYERQRPTQVEVCFLNKKRAAEVSRKTKETDITVKLSLDGKGESRIATGIHFFDHMLTLFAKHGLFDMEIACAGDLEVDGHHTVEDVGIALGEAFHQALGSKEGITRYGTAYVPMDETLGRTVVDFSGRPYLVCKAEFPSEKVGAMSTELVEEFFRALAVHARVNLHVEVLYGKNSHHMAEAMFKSAARAFCIAVTKDPRVTGIPSTKGVL